MKNCDRSISDRRLWETHPVIGVIVALGLCLGLVFSARAAAPDSFETQSEGAYTMGPGDTAELAYCLALYTAKRSAVEAAGEYFVHRKLVEPLGREKDQIYALAADSLVADILQQEWLKDTVPPRIVVRIRLRVRPSDLIEAEIEDREFTQATFNESLRREMEPSVSDQLQPGHDIAEGYRRIFLGAVRMAIIYLDRLEKKYPNWSEIYRVKALAYASQHQEVQTKESLRKACALGSQSACDQLKTFSP